MTKRVITYERQATDDPAGLEAQRQQCRAWAAEHSYTVIADYAEVGSGQAAYLPLREAAIEHAARHGAALLCEQPNRLTRSRPALAAILAECQLASVEVVFVEGGQR